MISLDFTQQESPDDPEQFEPARPPAPSGGSQRQRRVLAAAFLIALAADVISKIAAWLLLEGSPLSLPGGLQLRLLHNSEAPLGLGNNTLGNAALAVAALAMIAILVWAWRTRSPASIPVGLMTGGAAGNLFDRMLGGSVLDWIDPGFGGVFNIADLAIVTGLALFVAFFISGESNTRSAGIPTDRLGDDTVS